MPASARASAIATSSATESAPPDTATATRSPARKKCRAQSELWHVRVAMRTQCTSHRTAACHCSILTGMPATRAATAADAAIITHHRRRMFVDAGRIDNRVLDVMAEHFEPWVTQQLQSGNYMGWLALDDAGEVIGGSGLMMLDWPPHPLIPPRSIAAIC